MFKKIFGTLTLAAFVFGVTAQTSISKNLANACSCAWYYHNGDGWSN